MIVNRNSVISRLWIVHCFLTLICSNVNHKFKDIVGIAAFYLDGYKALDNVLDIWLLQHNSWDPMTPSGSLFYMCMCVLPGCYPVVLVCLHA